jgi:L-ascorbate metabolism protein UlaG (beta-lactamase superfamily)
MTYLKRAEKNGRKFLNPVPTTIGGFSTALKVLPKMLSNKAETTPRMPVGPFLTDTSIYATPPASGLRVTWFGHSGLLLEIDGVRILIDPIWEQRASPMQWMGPKRFWAPTMRLEDMPPLDAVLISHDHYDHLGARTIRKLALLPATAGAKWITSLGVARRLRRMGVPRAHLTELDWTQSVEIAGAELGSSLKITSFPARHFSGRGILDRFTTLWASFVLEGPRHRVYFGADTGWWEGFSEIGAQYDRFDLTLLEIGAFDSLWAGIHLGPDNAVKAFDEMGLSSRAGLLMPIHWGLFSLGLHAWRQPIERLELISRDYSANLWSPQPGLPTEVVGPLFNDWWR